MEIAVDTETTGLHWTKGHQPFGIGIFAENWKSYHDCPVDFETHKITGNFDNLKTFLENEDKVIYFHNAKFDLHMLASVGIYPKGQIHDTMFMARICDNREANFQLKPLAKKYLEIPDDDEKDLKEAVLKARKIYDIDSDYHELYWLPKYHDPENNLCEIYCLRDVERTYKLAMHYTKKMETLGVRHTYDMEMTLLPILSLMERTGIRFNRKKAEEKFLDLKLQLSKINFKLQKTYGDINFNSQQQVATLLLMLGIPLTERTAASDRFPNGQLKAGAKVLADFQDKSPICRTLVYRDKLARSVTELLNYCEFEYAGVISPRTNQCHAVTWRFSQSDPNLMKTTKKQNQGSEFTLMRDLFGPREGYVWVAADYEQIELRIFADSSQEPHLLNAFRAGKDIHSETTNRIPFLMEMAMEEGWEKARSYGKNTNFTIINGGGASALWKQYRIPEEQASKCIIGFKNAYPLAKEYMNLQTKQAKKTGFVTTKSKRRLFTDPKKPYTTAISYDVQPCAGDMMKQGLINCYDWIMKNSCWNDIRILLSIHDELIFEIKKDIYDLEIVKILKKLMELPCKIFCIPIPVNCDLIVNNWAEKEKIIL